MEILGYQFMQNALLAALLASLACGVVGVLVVCNRLIFLSGGAAHAAYGGLGLAFAFGWPVLASTVGFTLAASLLMASIMLQGEKRGRGSALNGSDTAIGVLWAAGMAFGLILIELTPGYASELMSFLFGSILAVPDGDLAFMLVFDALLMLVLLWFRQGIQAISLDRDYARAAGIPVDFFFLLLVGLSSVTIVILIRIVGLILVLALLTIPPYLALRLCKKVITAMLAAAALSMLFCIGGLTLAYFLDISSGPAIIAVAASVYFGVHLADLARKRLCSGKNTA